ncbi:hypothetical protein AAG906_003492 [Vitis piasezkii]
MESIFKLRVLNVLRYGDNLVAIPSFMLHMLHNLEKSILVPSSVTFENLATLDVWSCGSLVNLLPPSTAKSLVQLKNLKVGGSDMMKEVVSKEKAKQHMRLLLKIRHIALVCLANLTNFCLGGYTFTFPSLDHLVVEECPKMKVFSQGFSTTPRLERVDVADNEWHWEGDLSTTIQKLFIQLHG